MSRINAMRSLVMNTGKMSDIIGWFGLALAAAALCAAPAVAATKGPDASGYSGTDATVASFTDISGAGTSILGGTDDGLAALTLPFSFKFYGQSYTVVCASTNGAVYFVANTAACAGFNDFQNQDLTVNGPPVDLPAVLPLWSDLTFQIPGAGSIFYQTLGTSPNRRFVVQWNNAFPQNNSNSVTFEAILSETSNTVSFQYQTVVIGAGNPASAGALATVGIRNSNGIATNQQVEWSYDSPVLSNNYALLFSTASSLAAPVLTQPTNGATGVATPVTLTWNSVTGATSYDLYFGTTTPPPFAMNVASTSYGPVGLSAGTTYYWSVSAKNASGSTGSQSFSFTATAAPSCTYQLSASNASIASTGGSGSFNITTANSCAWTVTGAPAWVTITSASTGFGNATVNYSVATNSGAAQSATLMIGGLSYMINQAGASGGGGGGGGAGGGGGGGGGQPAAVLRAVPYSLSFTYLQGSSTLPAAQSVAVTTFPATSSSSFSGSAQTASGGNWLSVAVASTATTPGSASVGVSPGGLTPGIYNGTVAFTSPTETEVDVTVTLTVVQTLFPALNISPSTQQFLLTQASSPAAGQLTVSNIGSGTLNYQATASVQQGNWLSIASNSTGSLTAASSMLIGFSVNPSGLSSGTYNGSITVADTSSGAQVTASVILVVGSAQPLLQLSEAGMTMTAIAGGPEPPAQSFTVSNGGAGSVAWTAQTQLVPNSQLPSGTNWLSVSQASGSSIGGQPGASLLVSANPAGLAAGQYYGSVNISATGASNSPQTLTVLLNVLPAGQSGTGVTVSSGGAVLLGVAGTGTAQKQLTLFNLSTGSTTFKSTVTVTGSNTWLSVSPASGNLASGSNTISLQADFSNLIGGLQTGSVTLSFGDGSSALVQVIAIVKSAPTGASVRRPAAASATCAGGNPGSLISVFDQPLGQAVLQTGVAASVQVEIFDDCGNPVTASGGGTAQVTFSSGDPALTLNDTGLGVWQGTWNPATAGSSVTLQLATTEQSLTLNSTISSSTTVAVETATITPAARPTGGIVNAAAGDQATPQIVAPASYVAIYGSNLAAGGAQQASTVPLPLTLDGTQVLLGGQPMPLLYVGPGQINAIVPQSLNSGTSYPLVVLSGSTQSVPVPLIVTTYQPGIYTYDTSGSGQGVVEIAGTTLVAGPAGNGFQPAHRGTDYLQIYCTGLGPVAGPNGEAAPADGASAGSSILYRTAANVTVTIGGVSAPATFAGLTPTLVALYQVNVQVPAAAPAGSAVPLVITVTDPNTGNSVTSNTVTIALQ